MASRALMPTYMESVRSWLRGCFSMAARTGWLLTRSPISHRARVHRLRLENSDLLLPLLLDVQRIDCVDLFPERRYDVCAASAKAAKLIGGHTVHSVFNLRLNGGFFETLLNGSQDAR